MNDNDPRLRPVDANPQPVDAIIACAMVDELAPFREAATDLHPVLTVGPQGAHTASGQVADPPGHLQEFAFATLHGRSVLLVLSGIGLTNAATATARALALASPGIYLLAGTTGGLGTQIQVGDVVAGTSATYFDADSSSFSYQPGQIPQMPAIYAAGKSERALAEKLAATRKPAVYEGLVLSGNSFVGAEAAGQYRQTWPGALAADMETCAVAQTCHTVGVPWMSIRAVSDLCEPTGDSFHLNCDQASRISVEATAKVLDMLP